MKKQNEIVFLEKKATLGRFIPVRAPARACGFSLPLVGNARAFHPDSRYRARRVIVAPVGRKRSGVSSRFALPRAAGDRRSRWSLAGLQRQTLAQAERTALRCPQAEARRLPPSDALCAIKLASGRHRFSFIRRLKPAASPRPEGAWARGQSRAENAQKAPDQNRTPFVYRVKPQRSTKSRLFIKLIRSPFAREP